MARYTTILRDQFQRPVPGAYVTVIDYAGALATLEDDGGNSLGNPFLTDVLGTVTFNTAAGPYTIEYRYGGRLILREVTPVGTLIANLSPDPSHAGEYIALDAAGNPTYSTGTGADAGLRTDLAEQGGSLTAYQPADESVAITTVQSRLAETKSIISDFGADPTGDTSAIAAFNRAIAYANENGSFDPAANKAVTIELPDGVYDLRAGGLDAILVANVTFYGSERAILRTKNGKVFTLGNDAFEVNNFALRGIATYTATDETPGAGHALVWAENAARISIEDIKPTKLARLFACDIQAGNTVANVYIRDIQGTGLIDRNFVDIVNTSNANGAEVVLEKINVYPRDLTGLGIPEAPLVVPSKIVSATQANPVVITTEIAHGCSTGDKVHIRNVVGMTELNITGDFTATRIDDTSFSIGVDGTGYAAFSAAGYSTKRHWSYPYDTAVLSIVGRWDTAVIRGGVHTHWPYTWNLETPTNSGFSLSFVKQENCYSDLLGKGLMRITLNDGVLAEVQLTDSWLFSFEGDAFTLNTPGVGRILAFTMNNWDIGMLGGVVVSDIGADFFQPVFSNIQISGSRRALGGLPILMDFEGAGNNPVLRGIIARSPLYIYNAGTQESLRCHYGISLNNGTSRGEISNCFMSTLGPGYVVPIGTGDLLLTGNRRELVGGSAGVPEYLDSAAVTVGASPFTFTNCYGVPVMLKIAGGTVSDVTVNGTSLASATGVVLTVGRTQTAVITYSGLPTVTAVPINA